MKENNDLTKEDPDKMLRDLLSVDPLQEAENITGKKLGDDPNTDALGFLIMKENSVSKKLVLQATGDSYFGMSSLDWVELILSYGFEKLHTHTYTAHNNEEVYHVWWHRRGIILKWSTHQGILNGGNIYYNWRPKNDDGEHYQFTSSGSWHIPEEHKGDSDWFVPSECTWAGSHDIREAILYKIRMLFENGEFITPWVKCPFLWFVDFEQSNDKNINHADANQEMLDSFPDEVKKMIGDVEF